MRSDLWAGSPQRLEEAGTRALCRAAEILTHLPAPPLLLANPRPGVLFSQKARPYSGLPEIPSEKLANNHQLQITFLWD